jgi:hypothetical protein
MLNAFDSAPAESTLAAWSTAAVRAVGAGTQWQ